MNVDGNYKKADLEKQPKVAAEMQVDTEAYVQTGRLQRKETSHLTEGSPFTAVKMY
jgi:hypothetical protein